MTSPFLSVIVPAYNCEPMLRRALVALRASDLPRSEWELLVADDGSTDSTTATAQSFADRVVRVPGGPSGPGRARNHAAEVATGEVLVFVDSDVCVSPTALSQFAALFRARPDLGSAFGAYDLTPHAPGLVSQYRNLVHHYVHSRNPGPAVTFWAGCGAVRRTAFDEIGGFDGARYRRPQIEDIELGYRLVGRGWPIELHPEIQGKHLKRWTFKGGVITDFRDRGVPWMHLILERGELAAAGPLNLRRVDKALTILTPLALAAAVLALPLHSWTLAAFAAFGLVMVLVNEAPLLRWFAGVRGWPFALGVIPLRITYYALNACSAAWAIATHARGGDRRPPAADDSLSPSRASL